MLKIGANIRVQGYFVRLCLFFTSHRSGPGTGGGSDAVLAMNPLPDVFRLTRPWPPRRLAGALLPFLLLLAACDSGGPEAPAPPPADTGRGSLVSLTLLDAVTTQEVAALGLPVAPLYDVDLFQVVYRTVDVDGSETQASGALMVPRGAPGARPLVSYQHGTVVSRTAVASVGGLAVEEATVGVLFAATGAVTAMPDYLGLGLSPGLHPYVHAASLASAVVDMLRAARHVAEQEALPLDGRVFLIGYSEGGYATVAAQRVLEQDLTGEFTLTASAPMAGNYDMSGVMADLMLRPEPYNAPFFLPYTLFAYDRVYDLFERPSDVFVPPFDSLLPGLFDGAHTGAEIDALLPAVPVSILDSAYVAAFRADDNHPLRVALRENDLYDWAPRTPTRLYHCREDDLVPFENTTVAEAAYKARGATDVEVVELNFGGHRACAAPALLLGKLWFDTFGAADAEARTAAERVRANPALARPLLPHGLN